MYKSLIYQGTRFINPRPTGDYDDHDIAEGWYTSISSEVKYLGSSGPGPQCSVVAHPLKFYPSSSTMSSLFLPRYSAIILDLGDVLFKWSPPTTLKNISLGTLRAIHASTTFFEYERGRLTADECYTQAGAEFHLDPSIIREGFSQVRDALLIDETLISSLRDLKARFRGQLRVFVMSNMALDQWEHIRTKPVDWSIFDHIFLSGAVGERKPCLGFYQHVLKETNIDPSQMIFVDDKLENVESARSLGLHGVIFENIEVLDATLRNLLGDPACSDL